jgi:hypothetical protein
MINPPPNPNPNNQNPLAQPPINDFNDFDFIEDNQNVDNPNDQAFLLDEQDNLINERFR